MTPQFGADALIMAMPAKWRSVCTLSLLEERDSRAAIAAAGVFLGLGNAIIAGNSVTLDRCSPRAQEASRA
jgi:hypothetical protein